MGAATPPLFSGILVKFLFSPVEEGRKEQREEERAKEKKERRKRRGVGEEDGEEGIGREGETKEKEEDGVGE